VFVGALQDVLSVAKKGRAAGAEVTVSKVAAYVFVCARQQETKGFPQQGEIPLGAMTTEMLEIYKEAMVDIFEKRETNLRYTVFTELMKRAKYVTWNFTDVLLKYIFSPDTKLFLKTEALMTVRMQVLAHHDIVQKVPDKKWKKFCNKFQTHALQELQSGAGVKFRLELLEIIRLIHTIDKTKCNLEHASAELLQYLAQSEEKRKPMKRLVNRILVRFPDHMKNHYDKIKAKQEEQKLKDKQAQEERKKAKEAAQQLTGLEELTTQKKGGKGKNKHTKTHVNSNTQDEAQVKVNGVDSEMDSDDKTDKSPKKVKKAKKHHKVNGEADESIVEETVKAHKTKKRGLVNGSASVEEVDVEDVPTPAKKKKKSKKAVLE
jgi:hypothetical protein